MTQAEVAVNLAAARAALETILYGWEDAIWPVSERLRETLQLRTDSIQNVIAAPATRILESVDVVLPGEAESIPGLVGLDTLYRQIDTQLSNAESVIGSVTDRVLDETRAQVDSVIGNPLDLLMDIIGVFDTLVNVFSNNLVEAPELWQDLMTITGHTTTENADIINTFISETGGAIVHKFGEILSESIKGYDLIKEGLLAGGDLTPLNPDRLAATMDAWPLWVKSLSSIVLHFTSAWGVLNALSAPIISESAQAALKGNPITPLSAAELVELTRRRDVEIEWATDHAKRTGISPELFDLKYLLTQRFLDTQAIIELWRRTGDDNALDDLYRMGYATQDVDRLKTLAFAIPTPSDLVRFMVRDVFDPAAIAAGNLADEFDDKVQNAPWRQVGVELETLKLYWMAHWQLPSPTMFYEMFHRGFISEQQMIDALKVADYAPGWIDNLVKINYNVPGRIDVRRMWESGVITTREELVKRHRDMGYSPEDAETLATFVERLAEKSKQAETERLHAPIAAEVIRVYATGGLSYDDAHDDLVGLGYSDEVATFRLQLGIFERERDLAQRIRTAIGRDFIAGSMDESAVRDYLGDKGFETTEQDSLLTTWKLDKELRDLTEEKRHERDLSKTEIVAAYRDRILARDVAQRDLVALGYDDEEAGTILQIEDSRQQQADNKAAEAAIGREYVTRRIEEDAARAALASFGYTDARISALISRWTVEREERRPDLSAAQVERMLMQGVVSKDAAEELLRSRGYSEGDISLLMTLYGTDMSVSADTLAERKREFDEREKRLREQGTRRLDLTERTITQRGSQFTQTQQGIAQRFTATQTQQRALQTERLTANQNAQNQRLAAQTARDATQFAERRAAQERQIQATAERVQAQIDAQNQRAEAARAQARDLANERAVLQQQAQQAQNDRQAATIQAQADRLTRQIEAQNQRAAAAADSRAQLEQNRAAHQAQLIEIRSHVQEARDIAQNARRIADEARQEQIRIRTETRATARKNITTAESAATASQLQSLQFGQAAAIAEVTARFAALTATLAEQRRQEALSARQAAEQALAAATPAASLTDSSI